MPHAGALPDWTYERRLARRGCRHVAGMDEAGRGCLAGPVVAVALVMRPGCGPGGVTDSKLLTPARRDALLPGILHAATDWGIGAADAGEIDAINILEATRQAMRRAVEALRFPPDHLLIDAVRLPGVGIQQTSLIRGDRISSSIAAASIVAKVVRDRLMHYYDRMFPGFGFASHKGYGTAGHLAAVCARGASPIHRRTFRGVWDQARLDFTGGAGSPVER
ncbi:MAG TPA: ribonuclease HII [Candidatus Polarisedimenticolia bacterium]|nr:ribonuclease HII [Candidatus Polarisedimenticolia bacterium]